jgi:hypothetical protein
LGDTSTAADLPVNATAGGEYQQIEKTQTAWKWVDGTKCNQDMYRRIGVTSFSLLRVIAEPDSDQSLAITKIKAYMANSLFPLMGKLNDATFYGYAAGKVLFEGADISNYSDHMSCPAYHVNLLFAVRSVTGVAGANNDGWNFVLRVQGKNAGTFAKPKSSAGTYVYESASFAGLFT